MLGWRRAPTVVTRLAAIVAAVTVTVALVPAEVGARVGTTPEAAAVAVVREVVASLPERREVFMDGVICRRDGYGDHEVQQALMMLEKARRTGRRQGSTGCGTSWSVGRANELLHRAVATQGRDDDSKVVHGGPLNLMRAYLTYADQRVDGRPLLDDPGRLRQGLAWWMDHGRHGPGRGGGLLDIDPARDPVDLSGPGVTENHQLQIITAGLVLTGIFAGERHEGRPVAAYQAWYRAALWHWLEADLGDGRSRATHDLPADEKDSLGYLHVYLGDLWMLRDFGPDAVVRDQAEVHIDRLLADYAEDAVAGLHTGTTGRHYSRDRQDGSSLHVLNHLYFDGLGRAVTARSLAAGSSWGNWLDMALVTSDYDPAHPDFPRGLIVLARDTGDGYLVREGTWPKANWVEDDLALGFSTAGGSTYDSQEGGFFVHLDGDAGDEPLGLQVAPFVASPYTDQALDITAGAFLHKNKPYRTTASVVAPRMAVVSMAHRPTGVAGQAGSYPDPLPVRLWVQDGFSARRQRAGWLFLEAEAPTRRVYLAVRPVDGAMGSGGRTQGGDVLDLGVGPVVTVWEVSTSDDHASFAAFQDEVVGNPLVVDGSAVRYTSRARGSTLVLDRSAAGVHRVDGVAVDPGAFAHGVGNPYVTNPHGTARMDIAVGPFRATYRWDPDGDSDLDARPVKVVRQPVLVTTQLLLAPLRILRDAFAGAGTGP